MLPAFLLAAPSRLPTLFFALTVLPLAFLSVAVFLLVGALLPWRITLAWFVRILLCFHYYLSLFIFDP